MRKRYRKIFKSCAFVSIIVGLTTFVILDFNSRRQHSGNIRRNHLKLDFLNSIRPSNIDLKLDRRNEKWLMKEIHDSFPAGRLVCDRRRKPPGALSDDPEAAMNLRVSRMKSARLSMSRLSSKRWIGCCPPGDPYGSPYKVGSACCTHEIFDVSTHFCCTENEQVLLLTPENLEYCDPLGGRRRCRIQDLETASAHGMELNCTLNSRNDPVHCEFRCPLGSKPRNEIVSAACNTNGVFDRIPECCQGCKEDFRLNLVFLLQLPSNSTEGNSDILRKSLKYFKSHFKIGQENVRVGYKIVGFKSKPQLKFYSTPDDATTAIDNLSLTIIDSNETLGDAMMSLAAEFRRLNIERPEVNNTAVIILQDPPDDTTIKSSVNLKDVARVLTIATGLTVGDNRQSSIASSPHDAFRIADNTRLGDVGNHLHGALCGTECITYP